ncbi:MAG: hypothetical protein IJY08_05105 [Clostridia bacterium]|nr:hypothetical protein [Clostridia bacterium]
MKRKFVFFTAILLIAVAVCSCVKNNTDSPVVDLGGDGGKTTVRGEGTVTEMIPVEGPDTEIPMWTETIPETGVGYDSYDTDSEIRDTPWKDVAYDINLTTGYSIASESVIKLDVFINGEYEPRYGRVVAFIRDNGVPSVYLDVLTKDYSAVECTRIFSGMCKVYMDSELRTFFVYSATANSAGRCVLNAGEYMVSDSDAYGQQNEGGALKFISIPDTTQTQNVILTQPEAMSRMNISVMQQFVSEHSSEMFCTVADTVSETVTYDSGSFEKIASAEEYITYDILKKFYTELYAAA